MLAELDATSFVGDVRATLNERDSDTGLGGLAPAPLNWLRAISPGAWYRASGSCKPSGADVGADACEGGLETLQPSILKRCDVNLEPSAVVSGTSNVEGPTRPAEFSAERLHRHPEHGGRASYRKGVCCRAIWSPRCSERPRSSQPSEGQMSPSLLWKRGRSQTR